MTGDRRSGLEPDPVTGGQQAGRTVTSRARLVRLATRWGMAIILVGVLVNLGMAFLSLRSGALQTVTRLSPTWLIIAAGLGLVPTLTHGLRIRNWTGFLGRPTSARESLRTAFATELGAAISPKAIGGAPVKLGLLMEAGQSAGTAASIILLNNLEDLVFFAMLMPTVAFLSASSEVPAVRHALDRVRDKLASIAPLLLGVLILLVIAVLVQRRLSRRRRRDPSTEGGIVRQALRRARQDFVTAYALVGRRGKLRFLFGAALTVFQYLCRCSVATAVMYGLGVRVDPLLFLLLQWVVWASMIFVPTPGAALGAEASFTAVLSGFVPAPLLGLVGASWRFLSFYLVLLIGLVAVPLLRPSEIPDSPVRTG